MGTAYYSGDYNNQFNAGAAYYPPQQQQAFASQNYSMTPNYSNNFPTQSFYGQNTYTTNQPYNMNQMNQGYMNTGNYPNGYGANFGDQFTQQPQMTQQAQAQRPKSAPQGKRQFNKPPLEIRGGVVISSCHCAKKNGLQDHCGRSVCRIMNEDKRRRQIMWPEPPTKDTNSAMTPSGDANNLFLNPGYTESFDNQIVPSNAQPVPVSYNYGM